MRSLQLLLLILTVVGASTEPVDGGGGSTWPCVMDFVFVEGIAPGADGMAGGTQSTATANSSLLTGISPPGLTCSATITSCVLTDARHTILLSRSLLIQSGIEQNPGPPTTRQNQVPDPKQMRLDPAGNLLPNPTEGAGPANSQHAAQAEPQLTLRDIMAELRDMRGEMRQDLNKVKEDVEEHTADIHQMKNKQTDLATENRVLKEHITQLQDYNRRNNLIVGGVPEVDGKETWEETEEKIKQHLVVDLGLGQQVVDRLSIEKAHRLGKRKNKDSCRVIKVQFANLKDKERVLRKAREVKIEKPYFREDFSAEVLDARTKLKPGLIAARERELKAVLAHDKLIIQSGDKKNVYKYDCLKKEVKSLAHTFEDHIRWNNGNR